MNKKILEAAIKYSSGKNGSKSYLDVQRSEAFLSGARLGVETCIEILERAFDGFTNDIEEARKDGNPLMESLAKAGRGGVMFYLIELRQLLTSDNQQDSPMAQDLKNFSEALKTKPLKNTDNI